MPTVTGQPEPGTPKETVLTTSNQPLAAPTRARLRTTWRPAASGLALALAALSASAATTYTITGTVQFVPGTTTVAGGLGVPAGLNSLGQVVGQCPNCNVFDPATGAITSVRTLADGNLLTSTRGINTAGQVIGTINQLTSVRRNPDGSYLLLASPAGHRSAWPNAINDKGVGVGLVRDNAVIATSQLCAQRAVQWDSAGAPQLLGTLVATPYPWSVAKGVNSLGQAVGQSAVATSSCGLASSAHAVLFTPAGPKDLHAPTLPPVNPGLSSMANAINDLGIAVGHIPTSGYYGAQVSRAIVWNTVDDTYVQFGSTAVDSSLLGINNAGTVVGYEGSNAMVGDAKTGTWADLNTIVANKPAGWVLNKGVAINEAGQIAVEGYHPSVGRTSFLLTPTGTTAAPPAAPSNLIATATSDTQIRLQWADNASDETSQSITRCSTGGCAAAFAVPANTSSYTDGGLIAGTAYSYSVRAIGPGGTSQPSNTATATPTTAPPPVATRPAAPSGLTAQASAGRQVSLRWTDNANNETGVNVYRCQGVGCTGFSLIGALGADATGFQDTAPRSSTSYTYKVRASNAAGNSAYSNAVTMRSLP